MFPVCCWKKIKTKVQSGKESYQNKNIEKLSNSFFATTTHKQEIHQDYQDYESHPRVLSAYTIVCLEMDIDPRKLPSNLEPRLK